MPKITQELLKEYIIAKTKLRKINEEIEKVRAKRYGKTIKKLNETLKDAEKEIKHLLKEGKKIEKGKYTAELKSTVVTAPSYKKAIETFVLVYSKKFPKLIKKLKNMIEQTKKPHFSGIHLVVWNKSKEKNN